MVAIYSMVDLLFVFTVDIYMPIITIITSDSNIARLLTHIIVCIEGVIERIMMIALNVLIKVEFWSILVF